MPTHELPAFLPTAKAGGFLRSIGERAIYLAAVSQTLGAAQFGYFGGKSLELLLQSRGLPDSLLVVLMCSAVYVVFTAGIVGINSWEARRKRDLA